MMAPAYMFYSVATFRMVFKISDTLLFSEINLYHMIGTTNNYDVIAIINNCIKSIHYYV